MSQAETPSSAGPVRRISANSDANTHFVIQPDDNDVFMRSGKQVIESCQLGISIEVWLDELRSLFDYAAAWARKRPNQLRKVVAAPRGARTGLFVIPASDRFDFDLADALVDLEMDLMKEFNVGIVEVLQVPESELARFIDPERGRIIYDERRPAHQTVAP